MRNTLDQKKQATFIVNLALNSFRKKGDIQEKHHDFYQKASMADILRPLAKCYLKIVASSKEKIDVKGRFEALKKFMARPAKNQEENTLRKHFSFVEEEFTSNTPNAFDYFNTLLERQSSTGKLNYRVELTASRKNPLWQVDKFFLKTARFIKRFGIHYQNRVEDLGERIRQQPATIAELERFYLSIISSNQKDLSNYMASYIKVMESLIQNNHEDNYILVLAKTIAEKDSNRYIQGVVEKLRRKDDLAEIKKNIEEKFATLNTPEALKDFRDYHHNQIMPLVEEQRTRLKALCELAVYIRTSKYCQNECLNFIVRELSRKITLMVKNDEKHSFISILSLAKLDRPQDNVNKLMLSILSHSDNELIEYVSSPYKRSASGMFTGQQEIPDMNLIYELEGWAKKRTPRYYKSLVSSVTSMQCRKGKLNLDALTKLYDWCIKPLGDNGPKLKLGDTLKLFSFITSMQCGKGEPDLNMLQEMLSWCFQPLGEKGPTLKLKDAIKMFGFVAGMQHNKGKPNLDKQKETFSWCFQPLGEKGPTLELKDAIKMFGTVAVMQHGKGEADVDKLKETFNWCVRPLGERGPKLVFEAALKLFKNVAIMQAGKGEPTIDTLSSTMDWCLHPSNGPKLGLDAALKMFNAVAHLQNGKGKPEKETLNKILLECAKPLVEYNPRFKSGEALDIFCVIANLQTGRGAEETYRQFDKISKLISFCIYKYPDNYLAELYRYTTKQCGIISAMDAVIKNEPEAKAWFERNS